MVDENKILTELRELKNQVPKEDIRHKLLTGFIRYIQKQPIITPWVIRFEQRMLVVLRAAGGINNGSR